MPATTPLAPVRSLVEQAVLAPSSHNTQPWRFRIDGERVDFLIDRTRALDVNDPDGRELTISVGAALFNARVAAAHASRRAVVDVLPGDRDLLASLTLDGAGPDVDGRLFDAIAQRHTHRGAFTGDPLDEPLLERLRAAARSEGARLDVLGADQREAFAALVAEGDRALFADGAWRRELARWMRSRDAGDGLAYAPLAAPFARLAVRTFNLGGSMARKDAALARQAPALVILSTSGDKPADWVAAGQALQRVLLTAAQAGAQASFLNQPIQVAALRPAVAELVGGRAPQIALRVGHPQSDPVPAPRRPVASVVD